MDCPLVERVFTRDVIELIGAHTQAWDYRTLSRLQQVTRGWADVFGPRLQALPLALDGKIDELKNSTSSLHSTLERSAKLLRSVRHRHVVEVLSLNHPPSGVCEAFQLVAVLMRGAAIPRQGDRAQWTVVKKSLCETCTHHSDRALTTSTVARMLIEGLEAFRPETLSHRQLLDVQAWTLGKEWMDPEFMHRKSTAAAVLVQWLQLQISAACAVHTNDVVITVLEIDELNKLLTLRKHLQTHPHVCSQTGKRFKTARELTAHRLAARRDGLGAKVQAPLWKLRVK